MLSLCVRLKHGEHLSYRVLLPARQYDHRLASCLPRHITKPDPVPHAKLLVVVQHYHDNLLLNAQQMLRMPNASAHATKEKALQAPAEALLYIPLCPNCMSAVRLHPPRQLHERLLKMRGNLGRLRPNRKEMNLLGSGETFVVPSHKQSNQDRPARPVVPFQQNPELQRFASGVHHVTNAFPAEMGNLRLCVKRVKTELFFWDA